MITLFAINVILAVAWGFITGSFNLPNLILGFLLGSFGLWLIREQVGTIGYLERARKVASLALLFFYELVKSAIRVAWIVVQPRMPLHPAIIAFPLTVDRDFEIALLANLITLTPGTLSVDVSADRKFLFVHAIDVLDPDALKRDIAEGFEKRILEAFR